MMRVMSSWQMGLALGWLCMVSALVGQPQAAGEASSAANTTQNVAQHKAVIAKYCVTCHNDKLKTAGLVLSNLDIASPHTNAAEWEKVVRKLRAGMMPPLGLPRPDQATYNALAAYLQTSLDGTAEKNPGRPRGMHRLNRAEYANAVRDLLDLQIDANALLPPDDSSFGFDNIADVLGVSPALQERYLSAANKVSALAVGDLVCLGISHPCTAFDKWPVLGVVDDDDVVIGTVDTRF